MKAVKKKKPEKDDVLWKQPDQKQEKIELSKLEKKKSLKVKKEMSFFLEVLSVSVHLSRHLAVCLLWELNSSVYLFVQFVHKHLLK